MVSTRYLALLAAVGYVCAQEISSLDPCGQTCYNQAIGQFSQFGCGAGDVACMCKKPDWGNSINDCAKASCPEGYAPTVTQAASALCATATPAPPPAGAASTTSSAPAPTTPATTPAATTTPPAASPSSSSSSSQTAAAKLSHTSSSSSATSTSTQTKSTSTKSSTTTTAAASATTSAAVATGGEGMTTAAKVGVGVGITVAIAALIGAGVFFLLRRRQNSRNIGGPKHWKISEPMPSPMSRHYNNDDFGQSYETGLSDLEMKSRRYEDMVPRQQPRQMV